MLLDAGVDPKMPVRFSLDPPFNTVIRTATVLSEASLKGQIESVKLLIGHWAAIDALTVQQAGQEGHTEVVDYLLNQKGRAAILAANGAELLRLAASKTRNSNSDVAVQNRRYHSLVATF